MRPHNWAERFAGNLASYGADLRLRYSNLLEPVVYNGTRSLRICKTRGGQQSGNGARDPGFCRAVRPARAWQGRKTGNQ